MSNSWATAPTDLSRVVVIVKQTSDDLGLRVSSRFRVGMVLISDAHHDIVWRGSWNNKLGLIAGELQSRIRDDVETFLVVGCGKGWCSEEKRKKR